MREFEHDRLIMVEFLRKQELQLFSDKFVLNGRFRQALNDINVALCHNMPILIEGEAGVGKTALATEACRIFGNGQGICFD